MVDRLLPSREEVNHWLVGIPVPVIREDIKNVLQLYASGRLVDREAIDYEAAAEKYATQRPGVGPVTDAKRARAVVDAALPDLEV